MDRPLRILLADDSIDDRTFFKAALHDVEISAKLAMVEDGEELMEWLTSTKELPDVLFLDLNMPRKNGYECLAEIKQEEKLKKLPVVIISTSCDQKELKVLYKKGAWHFIHKPNEFSTLVRMIGEVVGFVLHADEDQHSKDNFELHDI
jgi:CheY-like chemotaxis protein